MRRAMVFIIGVSAVALSGCYHAVINTGLTPSGAAHVTPWAHGFIFGLVPPAVTDTKGNCPSGVATVETQQSFVNGLASFVTGGLYAPMTISYTCGKAGAELPGPRSTNVGSSDAPAETRDDQASLALLKKGVLLQF